MSTPAHTSTPPVAATPIDLPTLAITAVASATAAFVCSQIWAPGTLASAALMPVLIALLKEGLARPARAVAQVVPTRGIVRSAGSDDTPEVSGAERGMVRSALPDDTTQQPVLEAAPSRGSGRHWRVALVTGLLGFVIAAAAFTVPELVAGQSASGGGRETTIFGGEQGAPGPSEPAAPAETTTTTAPTETVTLPPAKTVTVPAPTTTTVPPEQTTTVPTTPAQPPATPVPEPEPEPPPTPEPAPPLPPG